jgi:hypothetical protein
MNVSFDEIFVYPRRKKIILWTHNKKDQVNQQSSQLQQEYFVLFIRRLTLSLMIFLAHPITAIFLNDNQILFCTSITCIIFCDYATG